MTPVLLPALIQQFDYTHQLCGSQLQRGLLNGIKCTAIIFTHVCEDVKIEMRLLLYTFNIVHGLL